MVHSEPQISVLDASDTGDWTTSGGTANAEHLALVRATEVKDRFGDGPGTCRSCRMDSSSARRRSPRRDPRMSTACRGLSSRARLSVGVAGLVVILSGCALGGSEGQSKESADAALSAIPGISEGSVNTRSIVSGLQEETDTTIEVHVEPGFSVPDPEALAEYLIGVAWSTKTKEATSTVQIIVLSDPQISIGDAVEAGPWAHTGVDPNSPERAAVGAAEVKERFGDWPGEVPRLSDGLIVGPTLEPAP